MNKIKKLKLPHQFDIDYQNTNENITDEKLNILYSLIEYQYKTISVKEKGRINIFNISSIMYIKSTSNYSIINLVTGESILTSKTLKYWENKIENDSFLRCHNSFLINARYVNSIQLSQNRILVKDIYLPVSQPNKKKILEFFK